MKVSKLDFNYRDICIFNIVDQLMIRELHLAHLFVTRYIHYLRFLQLVKKGEIVLKIQLLPKCTSIVGKIDLIRYFA